MKTTSIVFTGDIGFDRYMDKKWEDEKLLSSDILDFFHSADHVVANVEGALINAPDDGSTQREAAEMFYRGKCQRDSHCKQSSGISADNKRV